MFCFHCECRRKMTPFSRLGLGCGRASSAPTDGRRKREQIEIDHDQVYGHQFPRGFSAFPFPTSLQQAGTGLGTRPRRQVNLDIQLPTSRDLYNAREREVGSLWAYDARSSGPLPLFSPCGALSRPSFIPAVHSIRRRAQGRSRPAHLGRRRLGLEGPEHGGRLDRHG